MEPSFDTQELGIAFGFIGYEDVMNMRIADIDNGVAITDEAIRRSLQYANDRHNRWRNRLASDVSVAVEWFQMPGGGVLQDLDNDGNPLPTNFFSAYNVAFPIRGGGDASGTDRISRAHQTVGDANYATQDATMKDKRWHKNYMLAALLRSTSYPFLDRGRRQFRGAGELTVQPLANGDGTQYITDWGSGISEDNHYKAQANNIGPGADNPFPAIYEDLTHHVDAETPVDVYVADDLVASIQALPEFRMPRDPNVSYGSGESTVAFGDRGIGDEYIGYVDRCHIISMRSLPSGYMVGHLRGQRPLGYREYPAASLRGLFRESHSPDGNHMETRFLRFGGYGVRNRTAAVVYQIGSATYTDPALPMQLA